MISVKDKVILTTGAFGLIGKEISRVYLQDESKVIIAGHKLSEVAVIKKEFGRHFTEDNFLVCALDVTDAESIKKCLAAALEQFGRIDVLVNNAAIDAKFDQENKEKIFSGRFEEYPLELIRNSVEVNMLGMIQVTQAVCRQMLKQKQGNIINVASSYSLVAPNQQLYDFGEGTQTFKPVDYVATKSFIPNFTRYLATLYARDNIRCNAIAPHGIFNGHDEKFLKNFSRLSPVGRMCDKSEINGAFLFLASDASSYVTGTTLVLDGGWTAW
ncbi:MAG: SDR family oxidoreductase [Candidatus Electronema sp. V4]|uniref:SDR family oxidoreductase n=1 Tax=Candidatus Electronema sp. V4 TaxID=3454756 RepID=UPI00405565CA